MNHCLTNIQKQTKSHKMINQPIKA